MYLKYSQFVIFLHCLKINVKNIYAKIYFSVTGKNKNTCVVKVSSIEAFHHETTLSGNIKKIGFGNMQCGKSLQDHNTSPVKIKQKVNDADSNTVWIKEEPQFDYTEPTIISVKEEPLVNHVDNIFISIKEEPILDHPYFNKASIMEETKLNHSNCNTVSIKNFPQFDEVDSNTVLIKEEPGLKDLEVRFIYMLLLFHLSPFSIRHCRIIFSKVSL